MHHFGRWIDFNVCAHIRVIADASAAQRPGLQLLLNVGAHQDLRTLLVTVEDFVGAAQLVALQTVQQCHTHHGRCKEQTPTNVIKLCEL